MFGILRSRDFAYRATEQLSLMAAFSSFICGAGVEPPQEPRGLCFVSLLQKGYQMGSGVGFHDIRLLYTAQVQRTTPRSQ